MQPLKDEFPNLLTKHTLARNGELTPYLEKSSTLAAIDYIVSLSSDVFINSHGGNMGRALEVCISQSYLLTAMNELVDNIVQF